VYTRNLGCLELLSMHHVPLIAVMRLVSSCQVFLDNFSVGLDRARLTSNLGLFESQKRLDLSTRTEQSCDLALTSSVGDTSRCAWTSGGSDDYTTQSNAWSMSSIFPELSTSA
jgi:hypothetical protein